MKSFDKDWAEIIKKHKASIERVKNLPVEKWPQARTAGVSEKLVEVKPPKTPKPPKPKTPKAAPKPKVAPKPTPAPQPASRAILKQTPVKGPKRGFRMSPAPTATERAALRNQGASYKAHVKANRPKPVQPPKTPGKLRQKVAERRAAKATARQARAAKYASKGALGKAGMRVGSMVGGVGGLLRFAVRRVALPIAAIGGAYNIGQLGVEAFKGAQAYDQLKRTSRHLGKRGYKVTARPLWKGLLYGDPGLKVTKRKK